MSEEDAKPKFSHEPLYWAIGLLLVCAWFARDGWAPPDKTLLKRGYLAPEMQEIYGVEVISKTEFEFKLDKSGQFYVDDGKTRYAPPPREIIDPKGPNYYWRFNRIGAFVWMALSVATFVYYGIRFAGRNKT